MREWKDLRFPRIDFQIQPPRLLDKLIYIKNSGSLQLLSVLISIHRIHLACSGRDDSSFRQGPFDT